MSATEISPPESPPHALTPTSSSTMHKPIAPAAASLQIPAIFTNKQWIIPPRPKPGRKPAADAPPTKRKAQNREAQRNFRERRAARVGELEEQIELLEVDHKAEVGELNTRIRRLEANLRSLESELVREKQLRQGAQREVTDLRQALTRSSWTGDVVQLPPRHHSSTRSIITTVPQGQDPGFESFTEDEPAFGCGNCRVDRCECIEDALDITNAADNNLEQSKRSHSPVAMAQNKKSRHHAKPGDDMEIDFTSSRPSARRPPPLTTSVSSVSLTATAAPDPCGFCQDGTACLCAEIANDQQAEQRGIESKLLPALIVSRNPCNDGPGTCAQCRSDPRSATFCKSLEATRSEQRSTANPFKSRRKENQSAPSARDSNNTAITGASLSCADAYTQLSRHPAYQRASENPSSWMPNLATFPTESGVTAYEIEAASILQTFRCFENKFDSDP